MDNTNLKNPIEGFPPRKAINHDLRVQVAEKLLDFWMHEFATHGDGCARVQMDRAHAMLGDVNQDKHQSKRVPS